MSVIVSIEDSGTGRKDVKIAVPAPAVEAETRRVTVEYRKRARVPGFRKGKAPAELLEKRFGEEIRQEVAERLIPRYWKQAEAEGEFKTLMAPELGAVEQEPGQDLTFVARVDLAPEIELRNISDFDLPTRPVDPGEAEVESTIEDLRRSVADWVVVDRLAVEGDRVKAAISELGVGDEGLAEPEDLTFEIGHPQVWEELSLAATGHKEGQSVEFERGSESSESEEDEEPVQPVAPKRFEARILEVAERDLPPLDDAFASKVGDFESFEALKADLSKRLSEKNEMEWRRQREVALLEQLVERHPVEVSERVVYHEVERMLENYAGDVARQGVDVEKAGIDWQQLGEQMRPQAERRVRARLVLDRVAKSEEVELSDVDLEAAISSIARAEGRSTPAVRHALDRAGRLEPLRRQLLRDKTVSRLLGENGETDSDEEATAALGDDESTGTEDREEE